MISTYTITIPELPGLEVTGTTVYDEKTAGMKVELSIQGGLGKVTVEYADNEQVTDNVEKMTHHVRELLDELTSTAYSGYVTHFLNELFK